MSVKEKQRDLLLKLADVADGNDFDDVMTAFAYMLAYGLVTSDKSKDQGMDVVMKTISTLYDDISEAVDLTVN
jgi:HJR/Mrr/RecB family endonuclease